MIELDATAFVTALFGGMAILITALTAAYMKINGVKEDVKKVHEIVNGRSSAQATRIDEQAARIERLVLEVQGLKAERVQERVAKGTPQEVTVMNDIDNPVPTQDETIKKIAEEG